MPKISKHTIVTQNFGIILTGNIMCFNQSLFFYEYLSKALPFWFWLCRGAYLLAFSLHWAWYNFQQKKSPLVTHLDSFFWGFLDELVHKNLRHECLTQNNSSLQKKMCKFDQKLPTRSPRTSLIASRSFPSGVRGRLYTLMGVS